VNASNPQELAEAAVSAALARGADEAVATVVRNSVRQAMRPPSGALLERETAAVTLELEMTVKGRRAFVIADPPGDPGEVADAALSMAGWLAGPSGERLALRPPERLPEVCEAVPRPLERAVIRDLADALLSGSATGRHQPGGPAGAEVTDEIIHTSVCWHTGTALQWREARRKLWTWLDGLGGDLIEGGIAWDETPPDPVPVARRREQFAVLQERSVPYRGEERMPVLLSPSVAIHFLRALGTAFSGIAGGSPEDGLAGRIGRRVAGRSVSLTDDARLGHGPWGRPIDDEGSATWRAAVIDHGRLAGLLHTRQSAQITGARRAGQGVRRGPGHPVRPGPRGLRLEPGAGSVPTADAAGTGFEAVAALRTPSAGPRGVVSVPVLGWLLRSGEREGEPVLAEIADGLFPILRGLAGTGPDLLHSTVYSGVAAPAVLVDEMLVRAVR
jgi:predicted Zn-dependent protease